MKQSTKQTANRPTANSVENSEDGFIGTDGLSSQKPPEGKETQLTTARGTADKARGKGWHTPEDSLFIEPVRRWLVWLFVGGRSRTNKVVDAPTAALGPGAESTVISEAGQATPPVEESLNPPVDLPDDGPASCEEEGPKASTFASVGQWNGAAEKKPLSAAPMVRTMVEAPPNDAAHPEGEQSGLDDFLPDSLKDVFDAKDYGDPRVKALLRGRSQVDLKELARDLDRFTKAVLAKEGSI